MDKYLSIVLIVLLLTFFFNKNIEYILSVLAFINNISNSIIMSAMYFFSCLNDLIFHLASDALLLLLIAILISSTKLFQS